MERREFIKAVAAVAAVHGIPATTGEEKKGNAVTTVPWYRRTYRWAQTNITEIDPARYDIVWWRQHWKRTQIQGVIINAGGIFAYYPSKFPLQYRPPALGDRDLYGELARAAHDDGLVVLARMDSNRAHEAFHQAHPDWFAVDAGGKPYRAGELYVSCINSPYYEEYLPDVLREIIERSHPEGITDNSWSGLDRGSICYCEHCARRFRERTGKPLPKGRDWNDPAYRQWIQWGYARRLEIWDLNNRVTKAAGGPDCLWLGMNSGSISGQCRSFRDCKEICARTEIIMLDHQSRSDGEGFQHNALTGKLIHGLLGWDKLIPESMPMYQMGRPTFRLASKPEPEARMWMLAGFAGGIQPWWHHISAYHEDRRMYRTAEPILRWHKANEQYLVNRRPIANVGVVWSQQNTDFYGRDNPEELVEQPWRGFTQALIRARIPYLPVHVDHIEREGPNLAVLILPNLAALSDGQVAAVRCFVERGGALIATGQTSLCNEWGDPRPDFALADLFGVTGGKRVAGFQPAIRGRDALDTSDRRISEPRHTYLRLTPELRGRVYGPRTGDEPPITAERHPVLAGFDETDILPFGGTLEALTVNEKAKVMLTFIPPFPMYPPETAWMREPRTNIPGLVLNESSQSRVAYLPADIDRRFAIDNLPDHGDLLANLVRWAAKGNLPLEVTGRGLIDCELYQQPGRVILHLVNLTSAGTWRAPVHELIPVGPLQVKVCVPQGIQPKMLKMLVSQENRAIAAADGWVQFEVKSVLDHEVIVVES
ncbi:MAG: beta-galactosidase [Phycisphaerae bacterium]|nr:beta-galactosidase [Phycisphaerae bacterium]